MNWSDLNDGAKKSFIMVVVAATWMLFTYAPFFLQRVIARLTEIEGKYHGLRLPYHVVMRVLDYHSANFLLISLFLPTIVFGWKWLTTLGVLSPLWQVEYLYTLCGYVILSGIYLFYTYWKAMTAIKFANV